MTSDTAAAMPEVGSIAPDFTLPSSEGRDVTLSSFRGASSVLLAFYPLAFTSTCTAEMCAFTEDVSQFASAGTVVLPISVDSTDTLREYKQKYFLKQELLSDFRREVCRAYGVFNPVKFYANRAYVVIDREGVVRWTWQEQHNGLRRQNSELLEVLGRLAS